MFYFWESLEDRQFSYLENNQVEKDTMSNPHDQKKLLESRRKVEDQVIAMEHSLKDNRTTLEKAQFEMKTTAKIEKRQKAVSTLFLT